jgi:hypothetical protein
MLLGRCHDVLRSSFEFFTVKMLDALDVDACVPG